MDPGDSKNVYGTPRLQRPNFTLKLQGCGKVIRVKLGLCNLGFPYTYLESLGSIYQRYVFGFLVTWHALPSRGFKRTVLGTGPNRNKQ